MAKSASKVFKKLRCGASRYSSVVVVAGLWLDQIILKVFSNFNDSTEVEGEVSCLYFIKSSLPLLLQQSCRRHHQAQLKEMTIGSSLG